jgi:electron transfer flavoprotein alpha subunit
MDLKGILVVGEIEGDRLAPITKELLGGAAALGSVLNEEVSLLLVGENAGALAREGISHGAERVYVAGNPAHSEYPYDAFTHLVGRVCQEKNLSLCLMGHTDMGREVAPRAAARSGAGLCTDCVEIRVDSKEKRFIQTRPVYGGRAMAEEASLPGRLQIATVRRKAMAPALFRAERKGEVVALDDAIDSRGPGARLIERKVQEAGGIDLENAKVVVAGGGGIGSKEGFETLSALARAMEGAVGATRVPVDEGWVSRSLEIGQTGKIVSPALYIAIGISGATQHITGILGSKYIVAINKDPDANIFKVSDLGVVADYRELVKPLIESLSKNV